MKNNTSNINYQEEETNIREILLLLWDSKKIIIATTLIFILASFTYSQIKAPIFVSYAKVAIGSYLDTDFITGKESSLQIQTFEDIASEIDFNFNFNIVPIGEKFFSISSTSHSSENAENLVVEIVDYVGNRSKELINLHIDQDKLSLYKIEENLASRESEVNRLLMIKNSPGSTFENDVYLSQLFVALNQLKLDKGVLERKFKKSNLFKYSNIEGEISTTQEKTSNSRILIFGTLLGLALSVVIVFIRRAFHEK